METHGQIIIDTIRQTLEHRHTIETWCPRCATSRPDLDLPRLVREGHGNQRARDLFIHCEQCQTRLLYTLRPPSRHAKS
ncbi:MAG TPA: hypothetical protein VFA81_05780, partial [Burkholderiales bacterium]|nr:hypothetical protein [Burkholderiales bacterium]